MSTATRPATLTRPTRPVAPTPQKEPARSPEAVIRQRISKAHRAYALALHEWLRMKAVASGYMTPQGYTPLPIKEEDTLATIKARILVLREWLARNVPTDAGIEPFSDMAPSPELQSAPAGKEPKRFEIPSSAREVKCRSCGAPMYWVPTEGGKVAPVDPDGVSHFATCPNADAHRSNKSAPIERPASTSSDAPAHVREFLDLATRLGLSHDKPVRVARLAQINSFLMNNEKEPIDSIREIREEDMPLLKAGLQRRLLRWP